jgi:hypothetical protein
MKKAKLVRVDSWGKGQEIIIDEVTHLGRCLNIEDYRVRETPRELYEAKTAVYIESPDPNGQTISRNHCLIFPPTFLRRSFSAVDLRSLNGTGVNGKGISYWNKTRLKDGDRINLGGDVEFEFKYLGEIQGPHYGVMVGCDALDLEGTTNDIERLKVQFERRGFTLDSRVGRKIDVDALKKHLESYHGRTARDSIFLFYFAGHGSRQGRLNLGNAYLSSTELFDYLSRIKGQKLLILDGCNTSSFAKDLPENTALIANTGIGYEGIIHSIVNVNDPTPTKMGYCSRALEKILDREKGDFSVEYLVSEAKNYPRLFSRGQIIKLNGDYFLNLPSVVK